MEAPIRRAAADFHRGGGPSSPAGLGVVGMSELERRAAVDAMFLQVCVCVSVCKCVCVCVCVFVRVCVPA